MISVLFAIGSPARSETPVASVQIRWERNQVRVPVSVNGSAPFFLILDTGMPAPGIILRHSERVESLKLDFHSTDEVTGGGSDGAVNARVATADYIDVGGQRIDAVSATVLPPEGRLPPDVDGIVGNELFEKFAVHVDIDESRLDLFNSKTYEPPARSTIVPLRFRDRAPFVDARVTTTGGKTHKADLALDLGAGHSLWLNAGDDGRFAAPPGSINALLGRGLSGDVRGDIGRVVRFEMGGVGFDNVLTIFPIAEHQRPGGVDFRDGFVGAQLLSRFDMTFDYENKRLVLERGGRFDEPFEYDMTGLFLEPRTLDRRRVLEVLAGSPAAEAGIKPGDVLLAVDGTPVGTLGPDGVAKAFRQEGNVVRLTLERQGTTIEKTITLRPLI
jgi:hypothetical protein